MNHDQCSDGCIIVLPQDDYVDVDDYEADDEKENADCGDDVDDKAYDGGDADDDSDVEDGVVGHRMYGMEQ